MPKLVLIAGAILLVAGCSSTHNFKTDGSSLLGGGFFDEEVRPGLYRLSAKSNMALWPTFGAAVETWKMRADQLCGKDMYESFETAMNDGRSEVFIPTFRSAQGTVVQGGSAYTYKPTLTGYVLCNSANMTVAEAREFLRNQQVITQQKATEALRVELEELGGDKCEQPESGIDSETYYRRGKILTSLERYSDARACFFLATQVEKDTYYYRESCQSLGFMYEIGLGVDKDMQVAKEWYRKAGLQ